MLAVEVRPATEQDQRAVIDVITLAFSTDPMSRWAYPNPAIYLAAMPETVRAFGGNGFAHGTVHLVENSIQAGSSPTIVPMLRRPRTGS